MLNKEISIVIPNFERGGAERVAINLANYFASKKHRVNLVCFRDEGAYRDFIQPEVIVKSLNIKRTRYAFFRVLPYINKNRNHLFLSMSQDCNIVLGLASYLVPLKDLYMREASTVDNIKNYNWILKLFVSYLIKISYRKCRLLVCNSIGTQSGFIEKNLIKNDRSKVVNNPVFGYDFCVTKVKSSDDEWFNDKSLKVCLAVGRLERSKDFEYMVRIFEKVVQKDPHARLLILGSGSCKQEIINTIELMDLSKFIRIVDATNDVYPYYKCARLFIQTPTWEGFGNVLVEAMMFGLPVISSNCPGGPAEILMNGKYGHLLPKDNPEAFTKLILLELRKPKRIIDANISRAEDFHVQKIGALYEKIFCN